MRIQTATYRRLLKPESLAELEERYPRRRGIRTIRSIAEAHSLGAGVARSELESRFLRFLRRTGLPLPRLNVNLVMEGHWFQCDCVWHGQRLIVELDGRAAHGWRIVRIIWRQLNDEPTAIASDLRRMLSSP